ncbi:hypothetical protein CYMTET_50425 [Cymbomonas tetramitiformis]|nr:hypothetical protein CYMTET_50425 [Cymbomonas tetramitiformis]
MQDMLKQSRASILELYDDTIGPMVETFRGVLSPGDYSDSKEHSEATPQAANTVLDLPLNRVTKSEPRPTSVLFIILSGLVVGVGSGMLLQIFSRTRCYKLCSSKVKIHVLDVVANHPSVVRCKDLLDTAHAKVSRWISVVQHSPVVLFLAKLSNDILLVVSSELEPFVKPVCSKIIHVSDTLVVAASQGLASSGQRLRAKVVVIRGSLAHHTKAVLQALPAVSAVCLVTTSPLKRLWSKDRSSADTSMETIPSAAIPKEVESQLEGLSKMQDELEGTMQAMKIEMVKMRSKMTDMQHELDLTRGSLNTSHTDVSMMSSWVDGSMSGKDDDSDLITI